MPEGKYVLAVSGGVDSMVLLDLLSILPRISLIIAHFNHSIRADSGEDERLVTDAASRTGWPLEIGYGRLGPKSSEETSRRARYEFLESIRTKHEATKIITAHHQDDLIETALINILRGTNRRGLSAISDNSSVLRPLLNVTKTEIIEYARRRSLAWREDSTNQSADYLRNYIRLKITPKLNGQQKEALIGILAKIKQLNTEIDEQIRSLGLRVRPEKHIDRQLFSSLPDKIADELLVYWLRTEQLGEIDRYEVNRLKLALKTARPGTSHAVKGAAKLKVNRWAAQFEITP